MTASNFSYRHLYYFWVVAKEGGIARAAERLGMAIQTVSEQFATTGQIGFVCHMRVDVAVMYPAALSVITGVRP